MVSIAMQSRSRAHGVVPCHLVGVLDRSVVLHHLRVLCGKAIRTVQGAQDTLDCIQCFFHHDLAADRLLHQPGFTHGGFQIACRRDGQQAVHTGRQFIRPAADGPHERRDYGRPAQDLRDLADAPSLRLEYHHAFKSLVIRADLRWIAHGRAREPGSPFSAASR